MHNPHENSAPSICADKLTLRSTTAGLHLFHKENQLTSLAGLHTVLQQASQPGDPKQIYASDKGSISCTQKNNNTLEAKISWPSKNFAQQWTFSPTSKNTISWEIKTTFKTNTTLTQTKAGIICPAAFALWQADNKIQTFPADFNWQNIWSGTTQKLSLITPQNGTALNICSTTPINTLLQNTSTQLNSRIAQTVQDTKLDFKAGQTHITTVLINITEVDQNKLPEKPRPETQNTQSVPPQSTTVKALPLAVCFDRTKQLQISWNNKPLLTQKGLNTAIAVNTQSKKLVLTNHQTSAVYIKSNTKKSIHVQYLWQSPEFWEDETKISLDVELTLNSNHELALVCVLNKPSSWLLSAADITLSLNEEYNYWRTSFEQGPFPEAIKQTQLPFAYTDTCIESCSNSGTNTVHMGLTSTTHKIPIAGTGNLVPAPSAIGFAGRKFKKMSQTAYEIFSGTIKFWPKRTIFIPPVNHDMAQLQKQIAKKQSNNICVTADTNELYKRNKQCFPNAGFAPPAQTAQNIRNNIANQSAFSIKLELTRFSFHKAAQLAKWAAQQAGVIVDLRQITLELFPVQELSINFKKYISQLQLALDNQIKNPRIEISIADEQLPVILDKVSTGAQTDNPKDMLRLLGVVCEHAFIGPRTVVFDPHHLCNANCLHCWVHTPQVKHNSEFLNQKLSLETFSKIADDLATLHTDTIIFQGDGEPLMHKQLLEMIAYARNKGLKVMFFTNGYLLDEKTAQTVIDLGVEAIFCSLPAGNKTTFAKINPKMHAADPNAFSKIVDNCKRLIDLRKKSKKRVPELTMTHVMHSLNYDNTMEMAKNCTYIGADKCRFYLIRLSQQNSTLQMNPAEFKTIQADIVKAQKHFADNPQTELMDNIDFQLAKYDEQSGSWAKDMFLKHGCMIGWFFNLIPAKLDMSFCCHLRTVGHLDQENYIDIWYSPRYDQWRTQAKFMSQNKQVRFLNNTTLYDEHCTKCDNHQTLLEIYEQLQKHGLDQY